MSEFLDDVFRFEAVVTKMGEDETWNEAIEAAAQLIEELGANNVGLPHPINVEEARRIRELKR